MCGFMRFINLILLVACVTNVTFASQCISATHCDTSAIEQTAVGSDSFPACVTPQVPDKGSDSNQLPDTKSSHQCHFGHCSFTVNMFWQVSAYLTESAFEAPGQPIYSAFSLGSIDRPPRA